MFGSFLVIARMLKVAFAMMSVCIRMCLGWFMQFAMFSSIIQHTHTDTLADYVSSLPDIISTVIFFRKYGMLD